MPLQPIRKYLPTRIAAEGACGAETHDAEAHSRSLGRSLQRASRDDNRWRIRRLFMSVCAWRKEVLRGGGVRKMCWTVAG